MNFDFVNVNERLKFREALYWSKVFNCNLKIGTEIEVECRKALSYDNLRSVLKCRNSRGNTNFDFNDFGVTEVKSDGSLNNGVEIITVGRKVYGFLEQLSMFKSIVDKMDAYEPYISARAGWHNHIILGYGSNYSDNEMDIPTVILQNVLKIFKYYYPALAWITSTMSGTRGYTRYNYYHKHGTIELGDFDGVRSAENICQTVGNQKYYAINTRYMDCYDNISKFHLEFRYPDGNLFPVHMACITVLHKALIMKAISLSKYGILHLDDLHFNDFVRPLYKFKNGGDDRYSYPVDKGTIDKLVALSVDMVMFLEKEIIAIDPIAYKLLLKMAYEPPSAIFKRTKSNNYKVVNDYYYELVDTIVPQCDESLIAIMELIENTKIIAKTEEEWISKMGDKVACKEPLIDIINKIKEIVPMVFVEGVGYIVRN